jgi:ribosomal protein S5
MLIGMFLIGKLLAVKVFLKPQASGMGVSPSQAITA